MTTRKRKVFLPKTPCQCGGTLSPHKVEEYDASVDLGLPVTVTGEVPGLLCDSCDDFAVSGTLLELASEIAITDLLDLSRRLSGREAGFLRKAAVGIGQAELANKLGVSRATVARWEASKSLSSTQDFELRSVVMGHLLTRARIGPRQNKNREAMIGLAKRVLAGVRQRAAPKNPPRLRIAA